RNTPVTPTVLNEDEGDEAAGDVINPASIGGKCLRFEGDSWSYTSPDLYASRINLIVGRGSTHGKIKVQVKDLYTEETTDLIYDLSFNRDIFYYDNVTTAEGDNICAITVLRGGIYSKYQVT